MSAAYNLSHILDFTVVTCCNCCPGCRRNFENLQRHMKTQHPQFNKDDGEK